MKQAHTCDECGIGGYLHRHHEHWGPDVIRILCHKCHWRLHVIRKYPGDELFEATVGLTGAEIAGVKAMSVFEGIGPREVRKKYSLSRLREIVRFVAGEAA